MKLGFKFMRFRFIEAGKKLNRRSVLEKFNLSYEQNILKYFYF
jgi:hypothetical protein